MKTSLSMTRGLLALSLAALLFTPAMAAEQSLTWDDVYCFSQSDFQASDCSGIMLTDVPDESLGKLMLGNRQVRAGDVLTSEQISSLTFVPSGNTTGDAVISCLSLSDDGPRDAVMTLKIGSNQNNPPVAEDSEFTTYKNIPGQVPLTVSDPEDDPLTINIVKAPKRGNVSIADDGTVTYTPAENKVGKDSFVYTVTDSAGNVSEEATVRIEIEKPSDKQTYGDMEGDPAQLAAVWLREEGIYSGETVSGQLLFCPEETVSRGEFIAMCAGLMDLDEEEETLSTGFVDEETTPDWLSPYVSTALRCGYLRGIPTDDGLALNANSDITQAQAVKMVSSILGLDQSGTETVMATEDSIPAWATGAVSAMAQEGLYTVTDPNAPLTRREAALLLYQAYQYSKADAEESSLLSWATR